MRIYTVFLAFILLVTVVAALVMPALVNSSQFIGLFAMLIALPLITFLGARRNFSANKRVGEAITYHFADDLLSMKGETFEMQLTWDKMHKVTRHKNWLMIWETKHFTHPVPRSVITDNQLTSLKQILERNKVRNNL